MYPFSAFSIAWDPVDANPNRLQSSATSATTVRLTWRVQSNFYCDVLGYIVIYEDKRVVIPGAETDFVDIKGLIPETRYEFSIAAYTWETELPFDQTTRVTTPECKLDC